MSYLDRLAAQVTRNQPSEQVRGAARDILVELQRADGKAAALCATAGGLLAAGFAAASGLARVPQVVAGALWLACLLLGASIGASVWALRPALPRQSCSTERLRNHPKIRAAAFMTSFAAVRSRDQPGTDARRLAALASITHRKYRAIKVAVDLIAGALTVAGIGVLAGYLQP